jgi:hypothetical protein
VEEVQCGRGGVCVFAGCVFWTASTVFFGGGHGDERQMQKHTFLGGKLDKWISVPRFGYLWSMP